MLAFSYDVESASELLGCNCRHLVAELAELRGSSENQGSSADSSRTLGNRFSIKMRFGRKSKDRSAMSKLDTLHGCMWLTLAWPQTGMCICYWAIMAVTRLGIILLGHT